MPPEWPKLKHLVLDIVRRSASGELSWKWNHWALFEAIKMLRGLKTLYIQSHGSAIFKPADCSADLTDCVHLERVAL